MKKAWIAVVLIAVAWHATRAEPEAAYVVADFESGPETGDQVRAVASKVERLEDGAGGHMLRWTQGPAGGDDKGWIDFVAPAGIRPYHAVRFRARAVGGWDANVEVRIRSADGCIGNRLRGVGPEWRTFDLQLSTMRSEGEFDPDAVAALRFICWQTEGFELDLDDIVLLSGEGGWGRAEGGTATGPGQDPNATRWVIADFEGGAPLATLEEAGGTLSVVEPKSKKETRAGRWTVPATNEPLWINLLNMPPSLEPYRLLRFKARAPKGFDEKVYVRFRCGEAGLDAALPPLQKRGKWTDVEIEIPRMERHGEFDPKGKMAVCLVVFETKGFHLEFDDVELVKGPGGWAMTKDQHLAWVFGDKRKKKVKEIETEHFRIYTDSAGARKKFPKALEKAYDFVREVLDLAEMKDPLDVFIFQSSSLYFDFCVRKGWTQAAAEATAGHAASTYFATYYQSPGSPTVTHELTHSIVQRVWGTGGGSWFQEGVAVCVEERWQKRDAATPFAPRLRSGDFVPLEKFMKEQRLIGGKDVRGGANTSRAMYKQAGAFFEFLLRGPLASSKPDAIHALARVEWNPDRIVKDVERIYGTSLEEIETAWKAWGGDPPKP